MTLPRLLTAEALASGLALRAFVDGVNDLLATYTRIEVHRCNTADGSFVEVSDSSTRPVLVANRVVYSFTDTTGTTAKFYKVRLSGPSSAYSAFSEAFAGTTRGIVSLATARAAGITTSHATDAVLTRTLLSMQAWVEDICGQWFDPRPRMYLVPGQGSSRLLLDVPIIALEELYIGDDTSALTSDQYGAFTSRSFPDERHNPRIELRTAWRSGTRLFSRSPGYFEKGAESNRVVATLGFLEPDGFPPIRIENAIVALAKRTLVNPGSLEGIQGPLKRLTVDRATEEYASGFAAPRGLSMLAYMAGDMETLATLQFYRRRMRPAIIGGSHFSGRRR